MPFKRYKSFESIPVLYVSSACGYFCASASFPAYKPTFEESAKLARKGSVQKPTAVAESLIFSGNTWEGPAATCV